MRDCYKKLDIPDATHMDACPVCGAAGELYRYSETDDSPPCGACDGTGKERYQPEKDRP